MANALGHDLMGRVVVLVEGAMAPEYRALKWRLFRVNGGFGAQPFTAGTALFGTHLADGEQARWHGGLVERFATGEDLAALEEVDG